MIFQLIEIRNLAHGALQRIFQFRHVVFCNCKTHAGALLVAADLVGYPGGVLEIAAHGFLDLNAAVHQPKYDEQSHHGGHEVGVGHFPCASMVSAMPAYFLDDDNRWLSAHGISSNR